MHGNTRYRNSIVFSSFVWPSSQDLLCCFWYNDWSACLSNVAIFLQAIRTHYPHYGDMTAGKEELRRQHLDQWKDTEHRIQSVLQAAANSAYNAKKITEESWRQHFMSGWFFWHFSILCQVGSFDILLHLQQGKNPKFLNEQFHHLLCEDSNHLLNMPLT